MKVQQLVCGHSLGEITQEQAGRTQAFAQISHWVSESTANSTLCESFAHLYIALTPVRDIPASKSDSHQSWFILHDLTATGLQK